MSSIDLLRAVAALAVTALHATGNGIWGEIHGAHDLQYFLLLPVSYGGAGVYLFFVISGFCIHLRWARSIAAGREPRNDFIPFWKRRLRRLYPAYAAAMAIGIALALHSGTELSRAFGINIASHVVLLHNFDPSTLYGINPVFWTLAIEEQLYLLYFLVLWMRRRWTWPTILGIAFAVRLGWQALAFALQRYDITVVVSESTQATWFIWILGAIAVEAHYGLVQLPRWLRSIPLAFAVAVGTAAIVYLDRLHDSEGPAHIAALLFEQPGWALASFITLNTLVSRETWLHRHRGHPALRPLLWLGLASYSLYLFHNYVLHGLGIWGLPAIGLAIAAAFIGFALFERPFMRARSA